MTIAAPQRRNAVEICEIARRASDDLKSTLGPRARKRACNYGNISSTCEHLINAKPIVEPTAETVAAVGSSLFPYFPSKQTLHNDYSSLLNIWRNAHNEILKIKPRRGSATALRVTSQDEFEREIGVLRAEIKFLTADLARARSIIASQQTRSTGNSDASPDERFVTLKLLCDWVHEIREYRSLLAPLELTPAGLKISSRARPGMVVMKPELVDLISRSE